MQDQNRFPPVLTKRDFSRRYALGEFGNASKTWDTLRAWIDEVRPSFEREQQRLYHIRNKVPSGKTYYNVPEIDVAPSFIHLVHDLGVNPATLYISEMAPHCLNLIQGEVYQSEYGLRLFYSTEVGKPMRDVLKSSPQEAVGIKAQMILKYFLCYNSYEWLNVLLDRYPGHIIEFSTFDKCWGTLPHYNTVFWEVRLSY